MYYNDSSCTNIVSYETSIKLKSCGLTQSSDDDLRTLYALAIHECTHMIHGLSYHDEAFASAMTEAFAMCMPGVKKIQRIVNGIRRLKDGK